MTRTHVLGLGLACLFAFVLACANSNTGTPVAPTPAAVPAAALAAADATLKVAAPALVSPVNGAEVQGRIDLVLSNVLFTHRADYKPDGIVYRAQVLTQGGAVVEDGVAAAGSGTTTYAVQAALDADQTYQWRARAEFDGAAGPWSANATFVSRGGGGAGYIKGDELFDPLTNGQTVATTTNDVTFVPGKGVMLNSKDSYVEYRIATLTDGEFSLEAENIRNSGEEWKTKIMSMLDCCDVDTTLNPFRVTIDKRSEWVGQGSRVRFTMRSNGVDAGEPAGGFQNWNGSQTYCWKFEWRGGRADLWVFDGPCGTAAVKEHLSTTYRAPYAPPRHTVRLGSVGGRADNESLPNVIIRNVWVSPNPRPGGLK